MTGTAPIHARVGFDRRLFRRALTGWWQSVVPPAPFAARVVRWSLIWGGVLALTLALGSVGIEPVFVVAGLIGAGVLEAAFGILQVTRMSRFASEIGRHWEAAGVAEAVFDEAGLVMEDRVSRLELQWPGVEAVRRVRGGTVIRAGMRLIAVPDSGLPEGMAGREFRARLNDWRHAARDRGPMVAEAAT